MEGASEVAAVEKATCGVPSCFGVPAASPPHPKRQLTQTSSYAAGQNPPLQPLQRVTI
jgi:hypothetical protein